MEAPTETDMQKTQHKDWYGNIYGQPMQGVTVQAWARGVFILLGKCKIL